MCRVRVAERLEIAGSWGVPRGPRRARWLLWTDVDWPFGKLSLTESEIVLEGRGPLSRIFSRFEIPLDEVVRVERLPRWSFGGIFILLRFTTRSATSNGARFASLPRRIRLLERKLMDRGVRIES